MHAHTPPFTKPRHASDAGKLYDETSAIAAAQDAKLDPISGADKRTRVMPLVMADLQARIAKGAKDYGEPLTTHNGRDALWDAYEEALDLCLYLRQAIEERDPSTRETEAVKPSGVCTCPSGDGSLRWPCPTHPPESCAPKWSPQWLTEQADIASAAPEHLQAEKLREIGIGDVHPLRHAVLDERSPEDRL